MATRGPGRPKKVKPEIKSENKKSISEDFAEEIELALQQSKTQKISFVDFLTHKDFCNLKLSPVVRAIAEASEGTVPTEIDNALCQAIFKCQLNDLKGKKHRVIVVGAGQRGGKTSRLLAPKAIHCAWTVPLNNLMPGEKARALLIAPKKDQSVQAFNMAVGIIEASPILSKAIVKQLTESIIIKRPDGKEVEICIGAADKEGNAARSKTLVFMGMDEAAFFDGHDSEKDEYEIYRAATNRVELGGQIWMISTPWIEAQGKMEELIEENWGSHDSALIAARVSTRMLRPEWDIDFTIEKAELKTPDGQQNVNREIYAIPLAKGSASFFDYVSAQICANLIPPQKNILQRGAGIDLGFDNDFSALVIISRLVGGWYRIDLAEEWRPKLNEPLQPSQVRKEMAERLKLNKINSLYADSFSAADTKEQFSNHGIALKESPNSAEDKVAKYNAAREVIHQNRLCFGHLPIEIRNMIVDQLKAIMRKPLSGGRYEISAPRKKLTKTGGGGHCDTVSALVEALFAVGARVGQTYEQEEIPRWKRIPPPDLHSSKKKGPWTREGRQRR